MKTDTTGAAPALSVILPASNEEALIATCLDRVLDSHWPGSEPLEVIVVANGCRDATAAIARGMKDRFDQRRWHLSVLEHETGGKLAALNLGDARAAAKSLVYLDADVEVGPHLLEALRVALDSPKATYASGTVDIPRPATWASRAYARIYRQVPFMTHGVPGCGLFAVNAAGRSRWGTYPNIISDDTFVRLNFAPEERNAVPHVYRWPLVEGFGNLVRVRRRQNIGVDEVAERFPQLIRNDDKPAFPLDQKLRIALRDPVGFAVYCAVALIARSTVRGQGNWDRGR
ncbi:MAG: glycosyltransferase [Rhodobacteraceae bacterium]|nr:glycosyltransferase [Paracoccaceae bacterium]